MPIRLALYDGSLSDPRVAVVTAFSLGNKGVHAEIWYDNYRVSTFEPKKCMRAYKFDRALDEIAAQISATTTPITDISGWHIVNLPITDRKMALHFLEQAVASHADYSINIAELAMPKMMLDYLDHDLDCCHPEHWTSLFCSQFALLFLRRCAVAGILNIPKSKQKLLWSVNSKGCLPSRLQIIADNIFIQ